ncbi:MAG: carbohydrate ABC transporter permease [Anaerolineae bacterium]|nr:carbohydrate ABC transporter permease [Anaerolineae bacterium]
MSELTQGHSVLAAPVPARRQHGASKQLRRAARSTILFLLLVVGAVGFLAPFLWMVSTSLKDPKEVYLFPPKLIPSALHWENYRTAWTLLPFTLFLRNTCIITFHNVIATVASSAVVAYSFARLRARLRDPLFLLVLATMMVPFEVTMIPTFIMWSELGLTNNFTPLMLPAWFGTPFYIFLLRQFFMGIPFDLDDAATIDGCSSWGIFGRIILPLSKPALAAVAIFTFVGNWNNFLGPLIYLNRTELYTLAVGLNLMRSTQYGTSLHHLMAVSTVTVMPILVLYFSAQKYFIQGVTLTGIKA